MLATVPVAHTELTLGRGCKTVYVNSSPRDLNSAAIISQASYGRSKTWFTESRGLSKR